MQVFVTVQVLFFVLITDDLDFFVMMAISFVVYVMSFTQVSTSSEPMEKENTIFSSSLFFITIQSQSVYIFLKFIAKILLCLNRTTNQVLLYENIISDCQNLAAVYSTSKVDNE